MLGTLPASAKPAFAAGRRRSNLSACVSCSARMKRATDPTWGRWWWRPVAGKCPSESHRTLCTICWPSRLPRGDARRRQPPAKSPTPSALSRGRLAGGAEARCADAAGTFGSRLCVHGAKLLAAIQALPSGQCSAKTKHDAQRPDHWSGLCRTTPWHTTTTNPCRFVVARPRTASTAARWPTAAGRRMCGFTNCKRRASSPRRFNDQITALRQQGGGAVADDAAAGTARFGAIAAGKGGRGLRQARGSKASTRRYSSIFPGELVVVRHRRTAS